MRAIGRGTVIDGLRVLEPLGQGGTATVHLVQDVRTGTFQALKLMKPARSGFRWRIDREWIAVGAVQHPNVVRVHRSVDTADGHQGVLMDYVPGPTLREWSQLARPGVDDIVCVTAGLLRGLVAIHRASLAHRDLKPGNIILGVFGTTVRPVVLDFGVAKSLDDDAGWTAPDLMLGTPTYMSPEQLRDPSRVGAETDVFAVGVMLYELLSGRRLRRKLATAELDLTPPTPTRLRDDLPEDLPSNVLDLVIDMLSVDPAARPTAEQALDRLLEHLSAGDPSRDGELTEDSAGAQLVLQLPYDLSAGHEATAMTERVSQELPAPHAAKSPWNARMLRSVAFGVAFGVLLGVGLACGAMLVLP